MQLVAITGGRLDYDDFEGCEYVDLYGVRLLLDQLEAIAGVLETLPFQEIEELVKHDLQRARDARPEMFKLLRAEYQNNTLMSENNAQKLLSY